MRSDCLPYFLFHDAPTAGRSERLPRAHHALEIACHGRLHLDQPPPPRLHGAANHLVSQIFQSHVHQLRPVDRRHRKPFPPPIQPHFAGRTWAAFLQERAPRIDAEQKKQSIAEKTSYAMFLSVRRRLPRSQQFHRPSPEHSSVALSQEEGWRHTNLRVYPPDNPGLSHEKSQ